VIDVIVLCYHALSPRWPAALSTTPERFAAQIGALVARGYRGATFTQAVTAPLAEPALVVTFDDAYRSVIELAQPVLERHGLPATVFAPTDSIGSERPMNWPGISQWLGGPHEHELTPMSWAELRTLADAGWEVGSHTASHPHLTKLDDEALAAELRRSKIVCEREMEAPCTSLAYPYGDVDTRVAKACRKAGYSAAAALPERLNGADVMRWPRVGIYHTDDELRFRLKVSPFMRRVRASRAWSALIAPTRTAARALRPAARTPS
jgi:peptidoglycan/xylan/chitin deacetylase (PgdA/CDA1 family)